MGDITECLGAKGKTSTGGVGELKAFRKVRKDFYSLELKIFIAQ